MPLTIFFTLFVSSPLAPPACSQSEFVIPRARVLLHRFLEPSYQVRMLANYDWTRKDDDSTIF